MIYSINQDFFRGNFLSRKTVVPSELRSMEIKFPILGTLIDILINNVLSVRNDHWGHQRTINPK